MMVVDSQRFRSSKCFKAVCKKTVFFLGVFIVLIREIFSCLTVPICISYTEQVGKISARRYAYMNHGSLFSGGGGFDLAAEYMGWENIFHCEIDPFCQKILKHYWPLAISVSDIKQFDATPFKGKIDILTGGFPCQPFSAAGKRRGTEDNRYLWPDMLRVIREIRPRYVVAENVYGLLNWSEGLVFEQVHTDLEAEGYEVQAFILPACGVNAPHRRYRIWFVAHANDNGQHRGYGTHEKHANKGGQYAQHDAQPVGSHASDTRGERLAGRAEAGNTGKKKRRFLNNNESAIFVLSTLSCLFSEHFFSCFRF